MGAVGGDLLRMVKLEQQLGNRFPHEISGGQARRAAIARDLASHLDFIVLDEPMSALDVSAQARIINRLKELQSELKLTYLFISHDPRVVRHLGNRVGIMYLGKIVQMGTPGRGRNRYTTIFLVSSKPPEPAWIWWAR